MKQYFRLVLAVAVLSSACKEKEKEDEKKFISVLSLIEKQVAHIDTSLYAITKYVIKDSLHIDTLYIPREEFRSVAKDFLEIPDLSAKKVAKRYKEETRYDELLNRVIISYIPVNPEKEEIQKQEILVTPNIATGDKVNTILISRVINNRDGFLQKEMLWQMDKSFQMVTSTQKPGQPEVITTTKVTWNEEDDQ
ncbi:MAG TPA: hypothetical protein PKG90_10090 [Chitinophagaceae bacterium]|nr:hypothetical protein [Chitinophagaceae bacterium]HNU14472.1 hypothetical protein [Chitinophagaceae bacterium]